MAGQSRASSAGVLPPVFELAKARPGELAGREAEIVSLAANNVISFDDSDRARDVLSNIKAGVDAALVQAKINRLPEPVQVILRRAA